jgi:2-polyprenyl-6-hydroxyphenyl methylase/3-demethylubiquinone-9 3-methyltransferase
MPDQTSGLLSPYLRRRRLAAVRPYLGDGRVLDYGCGVGELARRVLPERYLGVDRDAESLAAARRRFPRHRFVVPEELDAAAVAEGFALVVALAFIEHLADPGAWLAATSRRLAPGGRMVLTTPEPRLFGVHRIGAAAGLFSREGAAEHQTPIGRADLAVLAADARLCVLEARRFLLGANQLFVLGPEAAGDGARG